MRKQRHRIIKWFVQILMSMKKQGWDLNAGPSESKISALIHHVMQPLVLEGQGEEPWFKARAQLCLQNLQIPGSKENTLNALDLGPRGVCILWVLQRESTLTGTLEILLHLSYHWEKILDASKAARKPFTISEWTNLSVLQDKSQKNLLLEVFSGNFFPLLNSLSTLSLISITGHSKNDLGGFIMGVCLPLRARGRVYLVFMSDYKQSVCVPLVLTQLECIQLEYLQTINSMKAGAVSESFTS